MTGNDPITAIVDQLAAHAEQLTRLDTREAEHHAAASGRLAELTGQAAAIGRALQEHAAALARLTAPSQADPDADGYHPDPAPAWWKLAAADRQEPVARLRAWVEQVYRPGYGHLAAALGPCWPAHDLCLYGLDILAELWSVLYLQPAPQPRAGVRPGRIPGPHPARPGRPAPGRDQPLRPPPQPRTGRRPALEQAMTDATLRQALAYAARGWPVFPCQPGQKTPATRHGYRDATTDPAADHRLVRPPPATGTWPSPPARPDPTSWTSTSTARPGTGTPPSPGSRHAGLLDGAAAYVRTPSGGLHAYFRGSDQRNGHLPAHHLDFRSRGGYVLAPPSQVDGKPYQLIRTLRRPTAAWTGPRSPHLLEPQRQIPAAPAAPQPRPGPEPPGPVGRQPGRRQPQRGPVLGRQPRPGRRPGRRPQPPGRRRPPGRPGRQEITRTLDSARRTGQPRPPAPDYQAEAGDPIMTAPTIPPARPQPRQPRPAPGRPRPRDTAPAARRDLPLDRRRGRAVPGHRPRPGHRPQDEHNPPRPPPSSR